ncbi:hypothetical protein LH400_22300 [Aurantimonas sp. VKM B-3413]|nr:hypothetical protein [Aurantimonas sp. VKM B-3413]
MIPDTVSGPTEIEPHAPVAVAVRPVAPYPRATARAVFGKFIGASAAASLLVASSLSTKAETNRTQGGNAHFKSVPGPTPKPDRKSPVPGEGWIGVALTTEAGDRIGIVERIERRPVGGSQTEVLVRQADWTLLGIDINRVAVSGNHLVFVDREPE